MKAADEFGMDQIPAQHTGSEMNAIEKNVMTSEAKAKHFFEIVMERLLDVNQWGKFADIPMSTFKLTDSGGNEVNRKAIVGDYIRIDIPGPGIKTGEGYDWVIIEEIKAEQWDGAELLSIRVRPSANPFNSDEHTAHFLTSQATSTFQVKRIGDAIYAEEHGRNEVPNTETAHALDNVRNTFVGWGAKIGFSYPQWKGLVKGLLNHENS